MKLVVDASVPSRVATATSCVKAIVQYTRQRVLTGDMVHLKVATRHELDVHLLPGAGRVGRPGEGALATLGEDVAGAGRGGDDVGADEGGAGDEGGEASVSKHREISFVRVKGFVWVVWGSS